MVETFYKFITHELLSFADYSAISGSQSSGTWTPLVSSNEEEEEGGSEESAFRNATACRSYLWLLRSWDHPGNGF
jgi:hypothetical protein